VRYPRRVHQGRRNNFDAIRLLAALTVVVGHAWPLTGTAHAPEVGGIRIHHLAVFVFFATSGYLISQSWMRSPNVRRFLAARALRIFPALAILVVLTIAIVGPLATDEPLGAYASSPVTWGYLQNLTLAAVYELPGVFTTNPIPVVNGSLWTLGPEFICYLCVMLLGLALARNPIVRSVLLTLLFVGVWLSPLGRETLAPTAMVFFGVGAVLASLDRTLPVWPVVPAIAVWLGVHALVPDASLAIAWLVVPFVVIAAGATSTPLVNRAGRFGDFSYGIYLWAFPVQQLVVVFAPGLPLALDILIVASITTAIAAASWHLVEKRALALKPQAPKIARTPAVTAAPSSIAKPKTRLRTRITSASTATAAIARASNVTPSGDPNTEDATRAG